MKFKKPTRRNFLATLGLGAAGMLSFRPRRSVWAAGPSKPYNVLVIGIDDLRVQLSTYGFPQMKTPNFERLAAMSLQFNHAYVQQAVCAASRASFLTGCRPDTTDVDYPYTPEFIKEFLPAHPDMQTHFFNHGYYSRTLGKVHHGPNPSLSEPHYTAKSGTSSSVYYALPENTKLEGKKTEWRHMANPWEAADVPDTAYEDGMIADETIATLRRAAKQDKPFYINAGFKKPHLPFCCPKKYWDLYGGDDVEVAKVAELGPELPAYVITDATGPKGWKGCEILDEMSDETVRKLIHGYYACTSFIDAQIGKLLDELETLDLIENTVILLWSDHGWHLGDHGAWGKASNFEWATRSPLYFYIPGMRTGGRQTDALVEYVDMFPTLTDVCGIETPAYFEGTSFAPLVDDPERPWKKAAFSQYPRNGDKKEGYTIRTARYRYTEWRDQKDGKVAVRELYDHKTDPLESTNLANESQHADTVRSHAEMMRHGWRAALPPGSRSAR
jgi:iduronate 2-sulfatase